MAVFGAPIKDPDAAPHCVQAAVEMFMAVNELNKQFSVRGVAPISIGIGIHTGEAVVGNIGSSQKMEYTAIGDAVNVASRIERLTRDLKSDILISSDTFEALKGRIPATLLGNESVRGRIRPVQVYAVSPSQINVDRRDRLDGTAEDAR
jgi:adenylate cyclase